MTRKRPEVRPYQTSLIAQISAGLAFFAVASSLIPFLAGKIAELRSLSPTNPSNDYATSIYAALLSPPVTLTSSDINRIDSRAVFENNFNIPFGQLESLDSFLLIYVGAFLAASSFLGAFFKQLVLNRFSSIVFLSLAIIFSAGVCFAILGLIVHSGRADWDEVYLFASAAENFAKYGIPGVSVSGNNPFAESSVDFLVIVVAGSLMAIFPSLLADTAVVVSGLVIAFFILTLILVSLKKVIGLSTIQSFVLGSIVASFPLWYLSFLAFMPTGLSILIWTLFAICFYGSLSQRNLIWASLSASTVLLVRWDLGMLAILAVLVTTFFVLASAKQRSTTTLPWRGLWYTSLPLVLLVIFTIWRLVTFGTALPSGLVGKSIGFDPAFISGGLKYWSVTLLDSFLLLPVIVLLILAFARSESRNRWNLSFALSIISMPSFSAVLAGGDWFPIAWARYTAPSVLAITIISLSLIMKPTAQALEPRVNAIGVKLVAASSTLLLLIPLNIESISRLQVDSSANTRVTCLAKAGFTLRSNFPEISTVATAEVNTLAFFAGASLTDLIGIVDSRTAGVPPAPLSAGDILHRRANPDLIFNDESDAIYLYEGADCSGKIPTLEEDVDQWNLLLNAAVTRYRAGKPSELFENYQPITLIAQNQIVARFLIKKSIASN